MSTRTDSEQPDGAVVLPFPCAAVRHAHAVLHDPQASELERALAASVLVTAVAQGEAVVPGSAALVRRVVGTKTETAI
jgi:hypothetical protein